MHLYTNGGAPIFRADSTTVGFHPEYGTIQILMKGNGGSQWVIAFEVTELAAMLPELQVAIVSLYSAGPARYPLCSQEGCHCPGWLHTTSKPDDGAACMGMANWGNPQSGPCPCPGYSPGSVAVDIQEDANPADWRLGLPEMPASPLFARLPEGGFVAALSECCNVLGGHTDDCPHRIAKPYPGLVNPSGQPLASAQDNERDDFGGGSYDGRHG